MSANVHRSDRVDQVKTADVRVKQGLGGLGGSRSRMAVRRVEWRGKCMEYATCGGFCGFEPQNLSGGSKERTTRGGIEELMLRLS